MMSLSEDKQAEVIKVFNLTSRYLDGLDSTTFDGMVNQIH